MRILPTLLSIIIFLIISKNSPAETIEIEFTGHDSYSIEVAHSKVGDTIEWLPKNEGHNVEFLAGPKMKSLPKNRKSTSFTLSFLKYLEFIYTVLLLMEIWVC